MILQHGQQNEKNNIKLLFDVVLCVVILATVIHVAHVVIRHKRIQKTLETFYISLYVTSDLNAAKQCIVEEKQDYFSFAMTMGGALPEYYETYAHRAINLFGQHFSLQIKVTDILPYTKLSVQKMQKKYKNLTSAARVTYYISFTSNKENSTKSMMNSIDIVEINNRWYMLSYLKLPIGINIYAY